MGEITRRDAMRRTAAAGALAAGVATLVTSEGLAQEAKSIDMGDRMELNEEDKKKVAEAEKRFGRAADSEQQLFYAWAEGTFTIIGIVHFPPGSDPYSTGTVTGVVSGAYKLTKDQPRAILDDDRAHHRVIIEMMLEAGGGGYVHARYCHRFIGPWRCRPWHFLVGWYGS